MYYLFRIFYFLASIRMLSKLWFVVYYLDFFRKPIVFKNLDIAFPKKTQKEKTKIAKNTYKNFLTFFEDTITFDKNPKKYNEIKVIGENYLTDAINSNKPIILMSAHFGNWEITPKFIAKKYNKPLAGVMREIENEKINQFFKKIRADKNIKLINKQSGAKEIMKAMIKEKRILGILIDQYSRNENAPIVDFFVPTRFNPAVSKLAKATKAVVIPGFCYKENGKYIIEFKEPKTFEKDIKEFTRWQAKEIENIIRRYPDEYYWFHNRWKDINENK